MKAHNKFLSAAIDVRRIILSLEWVVLVTYSLALILLALMQLHIFRLVGFVYLLIVWPILSLDIILPEKWAGAVSLVYFAVLASLAISGIILGRGYNRLVGVACLAVITGNLVAIYYVFSQIGSIV